jgi:hypothetical protein
MSTYGRGPSSKPQLSRSVRASRLAVTPQSLCRVLLRERSEQAAIPGDRCIRGEANGLLAVELVVHDLSEDLQRVDDLFVAEGVHDGVALALGLDEAPIPQHREVLGGIGFRCGDDAGELADTAGPCMERVEKQQTLRIVHRLAHSCDEFLELEAESAKTSLLCRHLAHDYQTRRAGSQVCTLWQRSPGTLS